MLVKQQGSGIKQVKIKQGSLVRNIIVVCVRYVSRLYCLTKIIVVCGGYMNVGCVNRAR